MSQEFSFLVWFLVLVVVYIMLKYNNINAWSSLVFALLISYIFLIVCNGCGHGDHKDRKEEDCDEKNRHCGLDFNMGFFAFISIVTFVIIIIYIFQKVFADKYTKSIEKSY